jgi:hypothetical protein
MSTRKERASKAKKQEVQNAVFKEVRIIYKRDIKDVIMNFNNYVTMCNAHTQITIGLFGIYESETKRRMGEEFYTWLTKGHQVQLNKLFELDVKI